MPKRKPTDSDPAVSTDPREIEALIGRVKQSDLPERDALLLERLLRLVLTLVSMLEHKHASIARLKRLLFSPRTEARHRPPEPADGPPFESEATAAAGADSQQHSPDAPVANRATNEQKSPRRGHGRIGAEHFTGAGAMADSTVRAPRG